MKAPVGRQRDWSKTHTLSLDKIGSGGIHKTIQVNPINGPKTEDKWLSIGTLL